MKWKKKGLVLTPKMIESDFIRTSLPTLVKIDENTYRMFFGASDSSNISKIFFVDIEITDEKVEIVHIEREPVLSPSEIGFFDEHGVWPSYILENNGVYYLYYIGWQRWWSVPFNVSIGLAVSHDLRRFQKIKKSPVLDRNDLSPFINTSPYVMKEGEVYKMWYTGGVKWVKLGDSAKHFYNIKLAISEDGVNWKPIKTVLDFKYREEYSLARPFIIFENGIYRMWYSFRASPFGKTYRIGYAESKDGVIWERKDEEVGINVSKEGWDSEMICYAFILTHGGRKYMFYNGNGYGRTGIGFAVLEEEKT